METLIKNKCKEWELKNRGKVVERLWDAILTNELTKAVTTRINLRIQNCLHNHALEKATIIISKTSRQSAQVQRPPLDGKERIEYQARATSWTRCTSSAYLLYGNALATNKIAKELL